jgi:hypothetical protein
VNETKFISGTMGGTNFHLSKVLMLTEIKVRRGDQVFDEGNCINHHPRLALRASFAKGIAMPKLTLEDIPQINTTGYPPEYADKVQGRWYLYSSDVVDTFSKLFAA